MYEWLGEKARSTCSREVEHVKGMMDWTYRVKVTRVSMTTGIGSALLMFYREI